MDQLVDMKASAIAFDESKETMGDADADAEIHVESNVVVFHWPQRRIFFYSKRTVQTI